ncbi:CobW family GTP-binding protein [Halalkalibacter kiskunsagensis]|uniref:CobW family GTP-binding protein n=1 Tax=Halalkalibacter kiskunsagensis TaxID=1548599 RepID=A0ABV6KMZ0_9BACI
MLKRIPVYILTGFLGSGKTTILKRMLHHVKVSGQKPALMLNELGSENVEKELFNDEAMIELLNGCICCTIQDDMRVEIDKLLKSREDIDVLLIEGTGIANPAEIIEALTHPDVIDKVEIQSVIGLVDASRYLEYQSMFQSSKEIRTMLKQQITTSTLLVVNKIDLLDEKKRLKVTSKLEVLKGMNVPMVFAQYGEVDSELLFERRFFTNALHMQDNPEMHHHVHHSHPFQAIKIEGLEEIDKMSFEKWLKGQSQSLLRAKGYIRFKGSSQLFSFQFASNQLEVIPIESSKSSCIILIGAKLDDKQLMQSLYSM